MLRHEYQPEWPDVSPWPVPVRLNINMYDESILLSQIDIDDLTGSLSNRVWDTIDQELSFERSLFFNIGIELALPDRIHSSMSPSLDFMRLEWPVATSYHLLNLMCEGQENEDLFYVAEEGSVEWRGLRFKNNTSARNKIEGIHLYRTPYMILEIREPGEFYQKQYLVGRVEITLPGVLLSGLRYECFDATGTHISDAYLKKNTHLRISTQILIDLEINLEQCFNRKVLSPYMQLYFEDVILEKSRVNDIALFLRDMGLVVSEPVDLSRQKDRPQFGLLAHKKEGRDELFLIFRANGMRTQTDRQTIIPGGKTYTTTVDSGNMELDVRAELRGNVHKLTGMMNEIHDKLEKLEPYWKTPK